MASIAFYAPPCRCAYSSHQRRYVACHVTRRALVGTMVIAPTLMDSPLLPSFAAGVPQADTLVPATPQHQDAMNKVFKKVITKVKAPMLLRQVFHDAATYRVVDGSGGLNASIQFELDRPENAGLKRAWTNVEKVKKLAAGTAAAGLSNADIIAMLGAASIKATSGPDIPVLVGRTDALVPDPTGRLPDEKAPVVVLKRCFTDAGLTVREFVCLCGAHTLGSKGFGDPGTFDNFYFKALLKRPWLDKSDAMNAMIGLPSDRILPDDPECAEYITMYANDQKLFLDDFANAYAKLTNLGYKQA